MPFHTVNLLVLVCIYFALASATLNDSNGSQSVKKDLKTPGSAETTNTLDPLNGTLTTNFTNVVKHTGQDSTSKINTGILYTNVDSEIPESVKAGFYFFIGLSILAVIFILVKTNRMRLTRAERKYGVQGDRITQELTPLPMDIEDDSDNEDHTLFDINRQVRVS